jgi:His/Glu/Gln/Arg/opine family amino acid ABC transporter permease subunit
MGYTLNFTAVWGSFDRLMLGLALGLGMAAAAVLIGCVIGLVAGFASVSPFCAARNVASLYVTMFRNLPILVIVLIAYFALPDVGIVLDKYTSFVLSLAIYAGAYLTEVFRAGLLSVPKGVVEAGRAIGLTRFQTSFYVVAPIMLRNALPALGSTMISLFKDTSIAAVIAIPELTFQARKINTETFRVVESWSVAAGLYVVTCFVLAAGLRRLERRFPRF